jgi:hypothetical protein
MTETKTQSNFDKLKPEEQSAVNWKANKNLEVQERETGIMLSPKNAETYLANARESIAAPENADGVRQTVEQYKREVLGKALRGFNLPKGIAYVCEADMDKPTRDGFECKAPAKSAEKFEEKKAAQEVRQ